MVLSTAPGARPVEGSRARFSCGSAGLRPWNWSAQSNLAGAVTDGEVIAGVPSTIHLTSPRGPTERWDTAGWCLKGSACGSLFRALARLMRCSLPLLDSTSIGSRTVAKV